MVRARIRWDWTVRDGRGVLGRLWDPRLRADSDARAMVAVQEALDAVEAICGPTTNESGPEATTWYYSIFREDSRRIPYGRAADGTLQAGDPHEHVGYSFHLWLVFPTEEQALAAKEALPATTAV